MKITNALLDAQGNTVVTVELAPAVPAVESRGERGDKDFVEGREEIPAVTEEFTFGPIKGKAQDPKVIERELRALLAPPAESAEPEPVKALQGVEL